jgi:gluconate 2-dehydrogenase gamma chain
MASKREISRRAVLSSAAIVPVAALQAPAQQPAPAPSALNPGQMKILEALVDRLIPSDETGPGAVEGGAQNYIDRQLAGYLASEKAAFIAGLQGMNDYARRVHGAPFADLPAARRDEVLTAMENGSAQGFENARNFFARARRLTIEGMFGDPYYGGNKNFAGWDLIRYPGPRPAVGPEDQRIDQPPTPYRRSAYGADQEH